MKKYLLSFFCIFTLTVSFYDLWKKESIQCEKSDADSLPIILSKEPKEKKVIDNRLINNHPLEIKKTYRLDKPSYDFEKIIRLPSDDSELSNLLIANGQLSEAEKLLTDSIKIDSETGSIDLKKARMLRNIYTKQGKHKKYVDALKNLPENLDKSELIQDHIAYCLENGVTDYNQLIPLIKSELQKNQTTDLQISLANTYALNGNHQSAIDAYQEALTYDKNPYVYYQLGEVYKNMGDIANSDQAFQQASVLSPEYADLVKSEK